MFFRDFCLKQGIEFIIFCLSQGIDLSIFVFSFLSGCLFFDDKQLNFYKRLLVNIRVKCLKQGIKKSEFYRKIHYLTRKFRVKLHAKTDIARIAKRWVRYRFFIQLYDSVLNRVGKSAIFVLNWVRVWGAAPHLPTQGYIEYTHRAWTLHHVRLLNDININYNPRNI